MPTNENSVPRSDGRVEGVSDRGNFVAKELPVAEESKKTPSSPGPFDVRTVQALVALMTDHDLSEIDLREGMQRLRLRRGSTNVPVLTTAVAAPVAAAAPRAADPAPASAPAKPARNLLEIKSETVGTFYSKPSPDAPPFVSVGSKISASTVVCLIEAMKLFNEVQAGCSGTVAEVCVDNGQPVEFGQVLYRVEPS